VHAPGKGFRPRTKFTAENDLVAPSRLSVIERSFGDLSAKHFLQTQRLCAELDFVASISLRPATLVLHRERTPQAFQFRKYDAVCGGVKLHYVSLADQSESQ
jgi:hypothetical protein